MHNLREILDVHLPTNTAIWLCIFRMTNFKLKEEVMPMFKQDYNLDTKLGQLYMVNSPTIFPCTKDKI